MILHFLPHGNREVSEQSVVDSKSAIASCNPKLGEFAGLQHRQPAHPHRIKKLEDRCVCSNAERQRCDNHEREAGTFHRSAQRRSHIAPQVLQAQRCILRAIPARASLSGFRIAIAPRALPARGSCLPPCCRRCTSACAPAIRPRSRDPCANAGPASRCDEEVTSFTSCETQNCVDALDYLLPVLFAARQAAPCPPL